MTDSARKSSLINSRSGIPSNEELIDELTKDVKKSCTMKAAESEIPHNKFTPDNDFDKSNFNLSDTECPDEKDEDEKNEVEKSKENREDFIDEEAIEKNQLTFSKEELENARKEANQLKDEGNEKFKIREFKESAAVYTLGLRTCPLSFSKDRAILYANRAAAKIQMELKTSAIEDCTKAIELEPGYLKPYLRRAKLYEETDKLDEALADHKKIIELDPQQAHSYQTIHRLQDEINVRNEKLKEEMLGKLKDLGNMFLRPFGLSTNNFQVTQDPSTGGYSMNFNQNPR